MGQVTLEAPAQQRVALAQVFTLQMLVNMLHGIMPTLWVILLPVEIRLITEREPYLIAALSHLEERMDSPSNTPVPTTISAKFIRG